VNHSTIVPKPAPVSLKLIGHAQARETLSLKRVPSGLGEGSNKGTVDYAMSCSGEPLLA